MAMPNSEQLLLAVQQFLLDEVMPKIDGRLAFHARVAANVLAIVVREIDQQPSAIKNAVLEKFLADASGDTDRELTARLRAGLLDENAPGLVDALLEIATAQVGVDNPKYSTYVRLTAPL